MRSLQALSYAILANVFFGTVCVAAKPQALSPLKRLTVGPYDNLQGFANQDDSMLVYTRSENFSSQIYQLNLASGVSEALTETNADAKNPALSPDGSIVAFTYFKDDAKGDICTIENKLLSCFTGRGRADHSPVWLDNNRLMYVSSDDSGKQSQLQIYDRKSESTTTLLKGEIYAPDLSQDAKYLVYNGRKNELVIYNLQANKVERSFAIGLPGISGPARFSMEGRYLYFAQYILDSNRDLRIDGRDTAAIFRIDLKNEKNSLPLQITSLDQNCSYPYPGKNYLYMTCAFEGALDVYRGSLEGAVPAEWDVQDLVDAHQVARSYSDRVLFLNHLYSHHNKMSTDQHDHRVLQNFMYAGEYQPMFFYLDSLIKSQSQNPRWRLWKLLFEGYARWQVLVQKRNTIGITEYLVSLKKELRSYPQSNDRLLVEAYFAFFENMPRESEALLKRFEASDDEGLYLATHLAQQILGKGFGDYLENKVIAKAASTENKLFHLAQWLQLNPVGSSPEAAINRLRPAVSGGVLAVLENEMDLYRLMISTDSKSAVAAYRPIVERVKKLKDDYFAKRMVFSRSLIVLSQAKRSRDIADIVSLWSSYLKRDSKEFPFAMLALRQTSIDIAYQFMNSKGPEQKFAIGAFQDSIRTSDDLEAHYQHALLNFGAWPQLLTNYDNMISQGLIKPEAKVFIESLKRVLDTKEDLDASVYANEVAGIESIEDDHVGAGAKFLYIGYLYHKQLKIDGFEYDRTIAELAHKAYTFALDAAVFNDRIRAAALQNLGILHFQTRNYSLAADFFVQRHAIGYAGSEERVALSWLSAKSNYLCGRYSEAYKILSEALPLNPKPIDSFREKTAFYAWTAGQYEDSVKLYQSLNSKTMTTPVRLGYGYALLKLNRPSEAKREFDAVVTQSEESGTIISVDKSEMKTQPLKFRFIALGLIAQSPQYDAKTRIAALNKRLALFGEVMDEANKLHFDKLTLSDQRSKEWQDLATLFFAEKDARNASQALSSSISFAREHAKNYGHLNNTVFNTLKNAWIMSPAKKLASEDITALLQGIDEEFAELVIKSALMVRQWSEVKLVQAGHSAANKDRAIKDLFSNQALVDLRKSDPQSYEYLTAYSKAVQGKK